MPMEIRPIASALTRNKAGALLVALQIALTLAIVSNVLFIIDQRMTFFLRPTGVDESSVFAIGFNLTQGTETRALLDADLRAVRALADVLDAYPSNTYPLRGSGWQEAVSLDAGQIGPLNQKAQSSLYGGDEHTIATLGVRLVAGRNFRTDDMLDGSYSLPPLPQTAIITQALATQLFRGESALQKIIYLSTDDHKPITVIGVIERLQSSQAGTSLDLTDSENSVILPMYGIDKGALLLVRVAPGHMEAAMMATVDALRQLNPQRVFGRTRPFSEIRARAYQKDRSMAVTLSILCSVLLLISGLGIVGLTSFWVTQRHRQIGTRRALGATRPAIVRYFLLENLLIGLSGIGIGIGVTYGFNAWLSSNYGVGQLPVAYLLAGAAAVLLVGQAAVLTPALRAARISPTDALRAW